jgi:hypothetical protein
MMHGAVIDDGLGNRYRVFDPPWWRLDLWAWWWGFCVMLNRRTARGSIVLTMNFGSAELRVYRVR